jgi:NAD dependent epimerase/dehydratase family enzyme
MQPVRPLRIVIPGGTGRLGSLLARHLHERGHVVSTITRFPKPGPVEAVHWDAESLGYWVTSLENADVVINLTACRVPQVRTRITELLGRAVRECACPPPVWLNAGSNELDEPWEAAVYAVPTPHTRKVIFRLAPVMSPAFGRFPHLLRLVRWGLGGEMGSGEQYMDWLHDLDFIRAVEFLMGRGDREGAFHITSPFPVPNHEFMSALRDAWCANYFGLPIPAWLAPGEFLRSSRVVPERLMEAGFAFEFPDWSRAAEDLVQRWRVTKRD